MRIISGKCRGLKLETLSGENTRPTLDRVKESVFNILGNVFFDMNVLDLFAGSGALGLEALSRGARTCIFVDSSKDAVKIIKKNIDKCRMNDFSTLHQLDFETALKKLSEKYFDIVFLDPPYGKNLGILAINKLDKVIKDNGIIVLETDVTETVPDEIGCFIRYDFRKYGRVMISFFRKAGFTDGGS